MPYDIKTEIQRIRDYYASDHLQQRFSALVTGETGSGKTFMSRTARLPVHIDSFDPGGTKCVRKWIKKGDIVADTRWEREDPYDPNVFGEWKKEIDFRIEHGYFDMFGTYWLDSATTWGDAAMNFQMSGAGKPDAKSRAGEPPNFHRDYTPQKFFMINYIKKLMNLPCDFVLTGHLRLIEETVGQTKDGQAITRNKFRFMTTGQAAVIIPLQFDELYVLRGSESAGGVKRMLVTDAQGEYLARSRLRADGVLNREEEPDIKALLKKIGMSWKDKAKL